ncbi:hypothetical protein VZT92_008494 [Zoarces viviparus]|uniref:Uncharacterized protein n=1 Tax=Zoarces viviparus TaxID=48416 RepID=A0AAW1FEK1_ZOAVI
MFPTWSNRNGKHQGAITLPGHIPKPVPIAIEGIDVQLVRTFKYLRLQLDNRLETLTPSTGKCRAGSISQGGWGPSTSVGK